MSRPTENMLRALARIVKSGGIVAEGETESKQTLRALEGRGLLDCTRVGPPSRLYEITTAGANAVELWWNGQGKS